MNVYEADARVRKAHSYARHLDNYGIRAADVVLIKDSQWEAIARACGQKPPSEQTIAEIEAILERMQAPRPSIDELLARMPE